MLLYFGWPFAAKALIDWNNKVHIETAAEVAAPQPNYKSSKVRRMILLQQGPKVLGDVDVEELPALQESRVHSV